MQVLSFDGIILNNNEWSKVKYLGENVYSATLSTSDAAGTAWGSNLDLHNEKLATS